MKIDPEKCIGCFECINYCPMGAIAEGDDVAEIDQDACVVCGVCYKADVCPADAIYLPDASTIYPRSLRAAFSDPSVQFPEVMQGGRGTEEMKTNDVTGKFKRGHYGMTLEFGRPGIGTRLGEIEKITRVLCPAGIRLEEANPVYFLLADKHTGQMKPEVLGEKVLSAILEFAIEEKDLEKTVGMLTEALKQVDTVVSWGVAARFAEDGSLPCRTKLTGLGLAVRPNAKINMGLGRPIVEG